jgi:hypothetical protein
VQIRVEAEWWWREKRFAGEKNMRFGGNESVKKGLKEGKSVLSCRVKKEGKKEKKIERERKNTMKIKVLRNSIYYTVVSTLCKNMYYNINSEFLSYFIISLITSSSIGTVKYNTEP